jgi:hypothetical protein
MTSRPCDQLAVDLRRDDRKSWGWHQKLAQGDPIRVNTDPKQGRPFFQDGELHLEIIVDR